MPRLLFSHSVLRYWRSLTRNTQVYINPLAVWPSSFLNSHLLLSCFTTRFSDKRGQIVSVLGIGSTLSTAEGYGLALYLREESSCGLRLAQQLSCGLDVSLS